MNGALDTLLQHPQLWRGERAQWTDTDCIASGHAALDAELPGGGWPRGTLTEMLLARPGIGELRLLLPALTHLSKERRWIALINPPYLPYAPAWQSSGLELSRLLWVRTRTAHDHLWAVEQALRAGTCGAVLSWPETAPSFQQLRRLQLAAEHGQSWGVIFRAPRDGADATPAAVRVQLSAHAQGLAVQLLKRRGARAGAIVQLALPLAAAPVHAGAGK